MDTKECIEFLEMIKSPEEIKKVEEIIEQLQRGQKFEKMWAKLDGLWIEKDYKYSLAEMAFIKQKYFPKSKIVADKAKVSQEKHNKQELISTFENDDIRIEIYECK